MSRKGSQNARASPYGAPKLSAFDVGHKQNSVGKHRSRDAKLRSALRKPLQIQVVSLDHSGGSSESMSGDEEADGEDNGGDGLQADEDGDEDIDPDVEAPPGCAIKKSGRQAGTISDIANSPERKTTSAADRDVEKGQTEDSSNDEAYGAVDLISDSEREGSDMDCVEERAIIDSENTDSEKAHLNSDMKSQISRPRSSSESSEHSWEGFDFGDGDLSDHPDFFDEQFSRTGLDSFFDDENDILGNVDLFAEENLLFPAFPPRRRVRFAEPLLEDSATSSPVTGGIPSINNEAASVGLSGLVQDSTEAHSDQKAGTNDSDDDSGSSSGYECELMA